MNKNRVPNGSYYHIIIMHLFWDWGCAKCFKNIDDEPIKVALLSSKIFKKLCMHLLLTSNL